MERERERERERVREREREKVNIKPVNLNILVVLTEKDTASASCKQWLHEAIERSQGNVLIIIIRVATIIHTCTYCTVLN